MLGWQVIALGMIAESHLGLEEMCATNSIKVGSRGCDRMQGAKGQMGVGGTGGLISWCTRSIEFKITARPLHDLGYD